MKTAKIFKSGNSQAVRLPKEFQFDVSRLTALAEILEICSFDQHAAAAYGDVRSRLEKRGEVIGPHDMLIAAHALSLDRTLVTNNKREFSRVEGLKLENWAVE